MSAQKRGGLAGRYAKALFNATPPESAGAAERNLSAFCGTLASHAGARAFLLNPSVPAAVRKETITMLLPEAPKTVANFLCLLTDRKHLDALPEISAAYSALVSRASRRLIIQVTAARPLEDSQLAQIREVYRKRHNALSADIVQETDPALIGGIRVQVDGQAAEDSLRSRLDGLRSVLSSLTMTGVSPLLNTSNIQDEATASIKEVSP